MIFFASTLGQFFLGFFFKSYCRLVFCDFFCKYVGSVFLGLFFARSTLGQVLLGLFCKKNFGSVSFEIFFNLFCGSIFF